MNAKGRRLILIKQGTYDSLQRVKDEKNNTFDSVINRLFLITESVKESVNSIAATPGVLE